jgi:hypothetical protein
VTTKVKAGFTKEALLKETAIDVQMTDGVVTLRGTVGSDAAKARRRQSRPEPRCHPRRQSAHRAGRGGLAADAATTPPAPMNA